VASYDGIFPFWQPTLIDFVICDVMSDMANKLLSLSLYTLQWIGVVVYHAAEA